MTRTTRTQDEIAARFAAADAAFGWDREVLAMQMEYEHIRSALNDDVTPEQWAEARATEADVETAAREYLLFAVGKAADARGISAQRSVIKLAEFAWLLGRDDVITAMDAAPYRPYGKPKLRAFADGMGYPLTTDIAEEAPC